MDNVKATFGPADPVAHLKPGNILDANSLDCFGNALQKPGDPVSNVKIDNPLTGPFFIDGSEIFASTSIGISLYPDHGTSYEILRQNADLAMYRVKNGSKGGAAFFDAGMEREALARAKVEQSLRLGG